MFPADGVSSLEAATKKGGIAIMRKFQDAAKEIRKELRKFRRRTDTESKTVALDKLEKLAASEDSIANVFKTLMGPVQNNADDLTNKFKELVNIGVRFDNVWATKVVKNMIHDSLMHAHWKNLVGTILTFIHDHIAGENVARVLRVSKILDFQSRSKRQIVFSWLLSIGILCSMCRPYAMQGRP